MKRLVISACVLGLGLAAACGGDNQELPTVDCTGLVPTYAEIVSTVLLKCNDCHSSTVQGIGRINAPPSVNFDTYAAATAQAKDAVSEVNKKTMPPKPLDELSAAEQQTLYKWALCGTPQ